ncbi:MAG: carboxypeptidase-like regulatory domain-containing protein, partial [Chromatiales bacterium]|nr:carboxypeptidase-like regulatory domain-containing protein [Chromatiales bacterium]
MYSFLFTAAFAQDYDGTLKGQIVDPSGTGIADQTIAISSPKLGFSRVMTTGRNGRFQVQLPPGDYVLEASGEGYTSVQVEHIAVRLGSMIDIKVPVTEAAIEEIVVFGEAMPLMKTAVGETGLQLSRGEIAQLPVPRDIDAVALLAPGTVPGIDAFKRIEASQPLVSFGGASVAENAYYVDGLNVSEFNRGLGGSSAPFEFYDQVQLK